jgi:Tat protein secretion system quality control protein TatD with DNase activity
MAAGEAGLDVVKLKTDFEGSAQKLFEADLKLARLWCSRISDHIYTE